MEQLVKRNAPKPDRPHPDVPLPEMRKLDSEDLMRGDAIDIELLASHFQNEGTLTTRAARMLTNRAISFFRAKSNVVKVKSPAVVVGNLHGHFFDLLTILEVARAPPAARYVFLGGYVNRGVFSCEVLLLLFALKINSPTKVVLLRGSHDCELMAHHFNFEREVLKKYSQGVLRRFFAAFRALQLGAVVGGHVLCVGGGLSPYLPTLDTMLRLPRDTEPEESQALRDLLWSDPRLGPDDDPRFAPNTARGTAHFFGREAALEFLQQNGLRGLVRSHEALPGGRGVVPLRTGPEAPFVATVFSAPELAGGEAAYAVVDGGCVEFYQIRGAPQPYQLPSFQNMFEWSLPFVIENLAQLIISVLGNPNTDGVHSPPECHHKQILDAICEKVSCAKASEGSKDPCSPLPCSVRSSRFDSFLSFRANAARECEQGIRNLTRSHVPPLALNSHGAPDRLVVTARPSMKDEFEKVREADEESEQYPM
eukprot:gnl/Chilomastix_cuspidata/2015.p1 GENE.gnl/Chilomastix_cuspidata/2015~~gnl/Chilomastix_cuspidata/2015.p1  ORF type:complete len:480 (-),score=153.86 gnl/Chilomastix_cuspidata/2015:180-1619(-)